MNPEESIDKHLLNTNISNILNIDYDMFLNQKGDTTLLSVLNDKEDLFNSNINIKIPDLNLIDIIQHRWNYFSL